MSLRVYNIAWLGKIKTDFWRDFWGIRGCVPNRRGSQGLFFTKIKNKLWVPPHFFDLNLVEKMLQWQYRILRVLNKLEYIYLLTVGLQYWQNLSKEHGLDPDGNLSSKDLLQSVDNKNSFFHQVQFIFIPH